MRTSIWLAGVVILALVCFAVEGEQKEESKTSADLAWVSPKAVGLISLRSAELWKGEAGKALLSKMTDKEKQIFVDGIAQSLGLAPVDLERVTVVMDAKGMPTVFARAVKAIDKEKLPAKVVPNGKEQKSGGRTYLTSAGWAIALLGEREYVVGPPEAIEELLKEKPKGTGGLSPALALVEKGNVVVVGANPTALPNEAELKKELQTLRPLMKASHATAVLTVAESKWTVKMSAAFTTEDESKEGMKALEDGRKEARGHIEEIVKESRGKKNAVAESLVELLGLADGALKDASLNRDGKTISAEMVVKVDAAKMAAMSAKMARAMREAAERMQSVNNLKQIGLAMHNYHDKEGTFPPQAIYDKDGKALLSWRVLLLPYLDQKELYDKFKLDEPWDSKHNKTLLEKVPPTYRGPAPKHKKADTTYYLGFAGKSAFFEGKKGLRFADFTDGTSNTIMIVEGGKEVPWSKPEDLPFDENKDLPKLGGLTEGGFNAAYCDGSVRFILANYKHLKALITRNGGEVIGND